LVVGLIVLLLSIAKIVVKVAEQIEVMF
jgi:hypothetical protein